ncbi:kinase-like protein [Gonapodya prolifera JEL478]|uniref:Kinase-like protein n=1 Tax=Gonapodya prolifera (strain JEL478) TaxID=1344416 RepID=A0A139A311_GONPJ|nr:kinase-like protein [Gonapodya prolifera JEL478]|eukprot:KXS11059.1 kinase-like protein [Gonapodya prolifera JEL478]
MKPRKSGHPVAPPSSRLLRAHREKHLRDTTAPPPAHLSAAFTAVGEDFPSPSPGEDAIPAGVVWSRYCFQGKALGTGGQSEGAIQLAALSDGSGALVALKRRMLWTTPNAPTRIIHEAAIGKILTGHPNVSRIVETLVTRDSAVLVTELVTDAVSWDDFLAVQIGRFRRGMATWDDIEDETWRIFAWVMRALRHFAAHGVSHNDIKPDNILVQLHSDLTPRNAVLIDPGLGHVLANSNVVVPPGQSPPYSPPEVARALEDPRSLTTVDAENWDVYSLGTTLVQVLRALRLDCEIDPEPSEDDDGTEPTPEELHRILDQSRPDLAPLVARMVDSDPAQRPLIRVLGDDPAMAALCGRIPSISASNGINERTGMKLPNTARSASRLEARHLASELTSGTRTPSRRTLVGRSVSLARSMLQCLGGQAGSVPEPHPAVAWQRAMEATVAANLHHHRHGADPTTHDYPRNEVAFRQLAVLASIADETERNALWDQLIIGQGGKPTIQQAVLSETEWSGASIGRVVGKIKRRIFRHAWMGSKGTGPALEHGNPVARVSEESFATLADETQVKVPRVEGVDAV